MIYAPWLSKFNIKAITIWKWVLFSERAPSPILLNHERIHLDQIRRDGVLKFYVVYLFEYTKLRINGFSHDQAYLNISYEKEAYINQFNLDYEVK